MTDAIFQQALAANRQGHIDEAIGLYQKVLATNPTHGDALHLLGVALIQTGRAAEGIDYLKQATALHPDNADMHNNLGNALCGVNAFEEAITAYDRAVALRPSYAGLHLDRGNTLSKLKRHAEALAAFDCAIVIDPNFAEAHANRGNALYEFGNFTDALQSYDRSIALNDNLALAHYGRANALSKYDRLEEARDSYNRAIALNPKHDGFYVNRGNIFRELQQPADAIADYDRAIALNLNNADAYFNKSLCLLLAGDMEQGWPLYEWRKKLPVPIAAQAINAPLWTGAENLSGKTLFVHSEQGLGDILQFSRYILLAAARDAKIIFAAPRPLHHLLQTLDAPIRLIDENATPEKTDYHIPLMSLPLAFQTIPDSIPAPYLHAQPALVEKWRDRIGTRGFKIGTCWQGKDNPTLPGRSFPLSELQILADVPDLRLISLQKGEGAEQIRTLPGLLIETYDFDTGPDAFTDTAAIMENLDLVITLDSATAHLAGALGRPTWVALKYTPDWRWLLRGNATPWHPHMKLFRQQRRGNWKSVFAAMKQEILNDRA